MPGSKEKKIELMEAVDDQGTFATRGSLKGYIDARSTC
jgi:hypothetical protein